jgi:hypothetical protein
LPFPLVVEGRLGSRSARKVEVDVSKLLRLLDGQMALLSRFCSLGRGIAKRLGLQWFDKVSSLRSVRRVQLEAQLSDVGPCEPGL